MKKIIPIQDGELIYFPHFIEVNVAQDWFDYLYNNTPWRKDQIKIFGKVHDVPRLQAWYGDEDAIYSYSNIDLKPLKWTEKLLSIKSLVERKSTVEFNSVLINLYRDGKDSNGWHSDDEKELGTNPEIASITLGQDRTFKLKHKVRDFTEKLNLENGSLLIMRGKMQHHWKHQIPKSKKKLKPRINLTFRKIIT